MFPLPGPPPLQNQIHIRWQNSNKFKIIWHRTRCIWCSPCFPTSANPELKFTNFLSTFYNVPNYFTLFLLNYMPKGRKILTFTPTKSTNFGKKQICCCTFWKEIRWVKHDHIFCERGWHYTVIDRQTGTPEVRIQLF